MKQKIDLIDKQTRIIIKELKTELHVLWVIPLVAFVINFFVIGITGNDFIISLCLFFINFAIYHSIYKIVNNHRGRVKEAIRVNNIQRSEYISFLKEKISYKKKHIEKHRNCKNKYHEKEKTLCALIFYNNIAKWLILYSFIIVQVSIVSQPISCFICNQYGDFVSNFLTDNITPCKQKDYKSYIDFDKNDPKLEQGNELQGTFIFNENYFANVSYDTCSLINYTENVDYNNDSTITGGVNNNQVAEETKILKEIKEALTNIDSEYVKAKKSNEKYFFKILVFALTIVLITILFFIKPPIFFGKKIVDRTIGAILTIASTFSFGLELSPTFTFEFPNNIETEVITTNIKWEKLCCIKSFQTGTDQLGDENNISELFERLDNIDLESIKQIVLVGRADKRALMPNLASRLGSNENLAKLRANKIKTKIVKIKRFKSLEMKMLTLTSGAEITGLNLNEKDLEDDRCVDVFVLRYVY